MFKSKNVVHIKDVDKPFKIDTENVYFLNVNENASIDDLVRYYSYLQYLIKSETVNIESMIIHSLDDSELTKLQNAYAAKMKIFGDTLARVNELIHKKRK